MEDKWITIYTFKRRGISTQIQSSSRIEYQLTASKHYSRALEWETRDILPTACHGSVHFQACNWMMPAPAWTAKIAKTLRIAAEEWAWIELTGAARGIFQIRVDLHLGSDESFVTQSVCPSAFSLVSQLVNQLIIHRIIQSANHSACKQVR